MNANRKIKRTVAAAMTGVMVASNGAGAVYAADKSYEKEETVYVKTNPSGSVDEVIVSDWLKNAEGLSTIEDTSSLTDIENVKGDETYTQQGDTLTWSADGNDIYYQGTTDKELPVSVSVTYYLDGTEISPEDLAGKSGHVKIHYQYENKEKQGDVYTPFMLVTGMILDSDVFANVEVTNGRLINDGSRNIVVGFGLPGLKDSLNTDSMEIDQDIEDEFNLDLDLNIPDSFDIEADVTDFETKIAMTVATPLNLSELDLDGIDSWDELEDKMTELTDGVTQLVDGTGELADGVQTLKDGCEDLLEGMTTLDDSVKELDDGMGQLDDGIGTLNSKKGELVDGVQQLADGLNTLNGKKGDLVDGVNALANGAGSLDDGAAALKKGMSSLYAGINSLDQSRPELISGLNALISGANQLEANKSALTNGAKSVSDGITAVDDNLKKLYAGSKQVSDGLASVNETLPGSLKQLSDGLAQISDGIDASLSSGDTEQALTTLMTTINGYADQVAAFADAVSQMDSDGSQNGYVSTVNQVFAGISQVDQNLGALIDQLEAMAGSTSAGEETTQTQKVEISLSEVNASAIAALESSIAGDQQVLSELLAVQGTAATVPESLLGKYADLYNTYSGKLDSVISQIQSDISSQQAALDALKGTATVDVPVTTKSNTDQTQAMIGTLLPALKQLKGATSSLASSAGQIQGGYDQSLTEGAAKLSAGSAQLKEQLAGSVNGFASQLSSNMEAISNGVKQAEAGVEKMSATLYGSDEQTGALSALADGSAQVTSGLGQMETSVAQQLAPGAKSLSDGISKLFKDGIDVMAAGLNKMGTKLPALDSGIKALKNGSSQLVSGTDTLKDGTGRLADGASQLQSGASQLADGVGQLADGGNRLNEGVGTLSDGIATLKDGSSQLKDGTGRLSEGTGELKDAGVDLNDGVDELLDGANELKDGVEEFNEKGVEKITSFIDEDLKEMLDRLDEIKDASVSYNQFSSVSDDTADSVKFIIETNGIELPEEAEPETETEVQQ